MSNIIFYSNKCKYCLLLLEEFKKYELYNYFKLFCIDGKYNEIKGLITSVPTLLLEDVNKPLVKDEVFKWFNMFKKYKDNNTFSNIKLCIQNMNESEIIKGTVFNSNYTSVGDNDKHDIELSLESIEIKKDPIITKKDIKYTKNELDKKVADLYIERKNQEDVINIDNNKFIKKKLQ